MRRISTVNPARLVAAAVAALVGVTLVAWGVAGFTGSTPPDAGTAAADAPGNQAPEGVFAPLSAESVSRHDLRRAFNGDPVRLRYEVLDEIPADPDSFTQGLEFTADGRLFESSGRYGRSSLRQIDPDTGATTDEILVDPSWFAEGITSVTLGESLEIAMLTWREGIVAFYDPDTLTERRRATYAGEGWGLCQLDDSRLVMSNGTPVLTLRDPSTFDNLGQVTVTRSGQPLANINELECVGGLVWANVWRTEIIVVIDPTTGEVLAELDASGLLDRAAHPSADVLNGIASVPGTTDEFWLAGKLWPSTWVVRVEPA